jgi:hypothetical protein
LYLGWLFIVYYLDNFFQLILQDQAIPEYLRQASRDYIWLTTLLGIPRQTSKDEVGCIVPLLGVLIDTNRIEACLPEEKLTKAREVTAHALSQESLSLETAQSLAGFLSFCCQVVPLGQVYIHEFWVFIQQFGP